MARGARAPCWPETSSAARYVPNRLRASRCIIGGPAIRPPIRRGRDRHDPAATDAATRPPRADWRAVAQGHHAALARSKASHAAACSARLSGCLIANIIVRRACAQVNARQFILMFRTVIARKVSHSALYARPAMPHSYPEVSAPRHGVPVAFRRRAAPVRRAQFRTLSTLAPCRQKLGSFFGAESQLFGAGQQEFHVSNCLMRLTGYQGEAGLGRSLFRCSVVAEDTG